MDEHNVPAAILLNAFNDPVIALIDRLGTDAASNPTPARVQALFDGIRPKLISSNPTSELLHDSQQLQVWAACAINLCELFRIRRHNMQNHPRLQTALFTFWTPFRRWVERLFALVLDMDIDESELCVTVAGLHDVWDVVGFFSVFMSEIIQFPQKVQELKNSAHHALQIRLWIKIRGCSRPRRDAEDRIGDVLDYLMPIRERSRRNEVYREATTSFSPAFMLHCLHRTIARIQSTDYGKSKEDGGDDWTSCLKFTSTVTCQSDEVFLLFNANWCLFWEVTAFRHQVASRSKIHGSAAYYSFWPDVVQAALRTFNDSPLWMPQAIDAGLLDFIYRSRIYLRIIEETSPPPLTPGATTDRMMADLLDELSAGLIHRQVFRKTRAAMRGLRKRHGDTAVDEAFVAFPRVHRSWRYLIQRLSDLEDFRGMLKDIGEDFNECANPNCDSTDAALLRCGGCQQVFYCSPHCRKIAWQDHRLQCKEDTVLREKGDVRRLDDRSRAFAVEYVEHILTMVDEYRDKWEEAIEVYANTAIPRHLLVADFDFTKKPFTLCAGNGMNPLYKENKDWDAEVQAAREEDYQLVHITIPFVINRPSKILVALYIGDGSTGSEDSTSTYQPPSQGYTDLDLD